MLPCPVCHKCLCSFQSCPVRAKSGQCMCGVKGERMAGALGPHDWALKVTYVVIPDPDLSRQVLIVDSPVQTMIGCKAVIITDEFFGLGWITLLDRPLTENQARLVNAPKHHALGQGMCKEIP